MYNSLALSNKMLVEEMVKQLSPTHGPWHKVVQLLCNCDEAFNDSVVALRLFGMPANQFFSPYQFTHKKGQQF
jgi:hypothetical protein